MLTLNKLSLAVSALALALLNTACSMETVSSKDVKSEAVYQNYSLNYDEGSNSTSMSAQFRVGGWSGTTVSLDEPSVLKINGREPRKSWMFGTQYEVQSAGFVSAAVFEYKDGDGELLTNSISIDPVVLRYAPVNASVTRVYEVDVEAVNLTGEEGLRVTLNQTLKDPQTNASSILSAEGVYDSVRKKAVFSTSELNKLNNGPASLHISRSKSGRLARSTREGGTISASYSLREVSVTIADKIGTITVAPVANN